jgi:hypothetical protein
LKHRIEAGWNSYRTEVVPPDAPEVQVRESRRAFYAGATWLFATLSVDLSPGAEPTEADIAVLSEIDKELHEFENAIRAGKA